jgi:predicted nuclease of predicted toxin-antitoxin system
MRILLDENIPRQLRGILTGHDVRTVPQMGWTAYTNGRLLHEAERAGFDAIVTSDRNFVTPLDLAGRHIAIIVLSSNLLPTIRAQPQTLLRAVASASPGAFAFATFGRTRRPRRPPTPTC